VHTPVTSVVGSLDLRTSGRSAEGWAVGHYGWANAPGFGESPLLAGPGGGGQAGVSASSRGGYGVQGARGEFLLFSSFGIAISCRVGVSGSIVKWVSWNGGLSVACPRGIFCWKLRRVEPLPWALL
jgi:hypothetical protein